MAEIVYNQSDFDYRREAGENQSSLKKILESPAHYQAAKKTKLIPTPAMEIGTALHCRTLDGEKAFDASYIKKPASIKLNTKEGKEWKEACGRRKPLSTGGKDDAWNAVQGMHETLSNLEWFSRTDDDYIKHNEVSIYWNWNGVDCKARLDRLMVEEGLVLDLKTTDTIEPEMFTKKVVNLGYDFQAAYYAKAAEAVFGKPFRFMFVAIERKAPYTVDLFEVSPAMMEEGLVKCEMALYQWKQCQAAGIWPNREPKIRRLEYPSWYSPITPDSDEEEDLF